MSRKRKKKSPLRNEFTDALNVELAERKIVERTQPKVEPVEVPKVEVEKVEIPKVEVKPPVVEKVEEIQTLQIVEVKTNPELEKRIFKEADNTFLDEKPKATSPKSEPPRKSIFRSKGMQRWEEEQREEKSPPPKIDSEPKVEPPRKMSRPEKFGVLVSVVMLIYAFVNFDKPLFFLAMSLFANFLRQPIGAMFGKHSNAVSNALHTFSIVVFFGALFFLFTS